MADRDEYKSEDEDDAEEELDENVSVPSECFTVPVLL
jgi:hypothetical protein